MVLLHRPLDAHGMQEEEGWRAESRVMSFSPAGLGWAGPCYLGHPSHDGLWTLELGTVRVAWSLGNPGYSNSQTPGDLSSSQEGLKVCAAVRLYVSPRNHLGALAKDFLMR